MRFNQEQLASWWCDLNAYRWPCDLPKPPSWVGMTPHQKYAAQCGAWVVVDALAGLEGEELWRHRFDHGQPVTDARAEEISA